VLYKILNLIEDDEGKATALVEINDELRMTKMGLFVGRKALRASDDDGGGAADLRRR
jgi:hypothetical protein